MRSKNEITNSQATWFSLKLIAIVFAIFFVIVTMTGMYNLSYQLCDLHVKCIELDKHMKSINKEIDEIQEKILDLQQRTVVLEERIDELEDEFDEANEE